jgi:hypothetical protein
LRPYSRFALGFWPLGWSQSEKEKDMGDGPVVVQSGGGGTTAIALIVAVIAAGVLLYLFGVFDFRTGRDVDVNINAPIETPADTPASPTPSAPADSDG